MNEHRPAFTPKEAPDLVDTLRGEIELRHRAVTARLTELLNARQKAKTDIKRLRRESKNLARVLRAISPKNP